MSVETEQNYQAACAALDARLNVERARPQDINAAEVFSLGSIAQVAAALDNPHLAYSVLHIAGSKGKGTIAHLAAAGLGVGGVGLYTSPHIVSRCERIIIDGLQVSPANFARGVFAVLEAEGRLNVNAQRSDGASAFRRLLTSFEVLTLAAFWIFAQAKVRLAIIEVGMGGTNDATNIVHPVACVIAAIELEHTQLLGTTLAQIASVKAGIMKPGVPCITFEQPPEVMAAFQARSAAVGAPLIVLGRSCDVNITSIPFHTVCTLPEDNVGKELESRPRLGSLRAQSSRLRLRLASGAQCEMTFARANSAYARNAALALVSVGLLRRAEGVGDAEWLGLACARMTRARLPGRMEVWWMQGSSGQAGSARRLSQEGGASVSQAPHDLPVILDGAHTPASIAGLLEVLGLKNASDQNSSEEPRARAALLLAVAQDKKIAEIAQFLAQANIDLYCCDASSLGPRAAPPPHVAGVFTAAGGTISTQVGIDVRAALIDASRRAEIGLVVVAGSFTIVAQARAALLELGGVPDSPALGPSPDSL